MKKSVLIAVFCLLSVQITHAFDQQQAFEKLYKTLALTGNQMPFGDADIPNVDEVNTDFVRQLIFLNELTTDVVYSQWGDPGLPNLVLGKLESSWALRHPATTWNTRWMPRIPPVISRKH